MFSNSEIEKPVPGDGEVLIKIHAATVTAGDCELRSFTFPVWLWLPVRIMMGLTKPRMQILGQEVAGEIEAVGKDVANFRTGDQVFATCPQFGAHAEFICLPGDGPIAIKPTNMSYGEAATIPTGAYNALHFLRKANIQNGQKVIINGAAGGIGVLAIQLAKHFGAEVTGVDSTKKLDTLREIGADHVIDYTQVDFTKTGESYDVILDVFGKSHFSSCIKALRPNGLYLLANPLLSSMLRGSWTSRTSDKKVIFAFADPTPEALAFVGSLIEAGTVKAVVDRTYPLEQMTEAQTYVELGQKKGTVVITL